MKKSASRSDDDYAVHGGDSNDLGGYEKSVSRLFEEHNQSLLRFVTARLHSHQEAKEIAQEAYVRLLKLDEPNTVSYLRAYLFRIAANLVSDRLKQRERRSRLRNLVLFEQETSSPSPESILDAHDELKVIQSAILELPAKCRKAFLLHKIHNMSIESTSKEMNLSARMVRLHIARAVAHCQERLDSANNLGSQ